MPLTVRFEWPLGGQEGQAATYECAESGLEAAKFEAAILYASASFGPRAPTAYSILSPDGDVLYRYPERASDRTIYLVG